MLGTIHLDFRKMQEKLKTYQEMHFNTADELWDHLSPTRNIGLKIPHRIIYRGHGDSKWKIIPSALREEHLKKNFHYFRNDEMTADRIVSDEILSLELFVRYCDRVGIAIPNDSIEFRKNYIGQNAYYSLLAQNFPSKWPYPELYNLLALAQHHGIPTRLLDWTELPYTATYFAASSCTASYQDWSEDTKLAIWALDSSKLEVDDKFIPYYAPGSVSPHLAAQYGRFTIHPHNGERHSSFTITPLENLIYERENPPLYKLTLPAFESVRLLGLCIYAGFSAADIYPTADGAGKAVNDDRNIVSARTYWRKNGVNLRFSS